MPKLAETRRGEGEGNVKHLTKTQYDNTSQHEDCEKGSEWSLISRPS